MVRSFLGAPLLDRAGEVRGGLLLGHAEPDQFTEEDKAILLNLTGQAAVALENARLFRLSQVQATELQTMFDSFADGITLVDGQGKVRRENAAARQVRQTVLDGPQAQMYLDELLFTPAQVVLIGTEVHECVVNVVQKAQEVVISIRDHGIGIPQHEQVRLFGRFARVDNTSTHNISGSGLGLYLSRELLERHAGRIWFESTEGVAQSFLWPCPSWLQLQHFCEQRPLPIFRTRLLLCL